MPSRALDLAFELATSAGFDELHDPNPDTGLIEPYHDPIGYPTQGYGRLLSRVRWEPLDKYPPVSLATAKDWLASDLRRAAAAVARLCPVPLLDTQRAALIDFAFNCGGGNLQASTLRRRVNDGDHEAAAGEFRKWVWAGGVKLAGLVRRRRAEAALYLS